jgi:hypothetical protein
LLCCSPSVCFSEFEPFRIGGSLTLAGESSPEPRLLGSALTVGELLPVEPLSDAGLDTGKGVSRLPCSLNMALRLYRDSRRS